jgi:undecaprenyl-diphosphatase
LCRGLTEFAPASSTTHLLISQRLMGIPATDAMFFFLVWVQIEMIVSQVVYFWKALLTILVDTLKNLGNLRDSKSLPENAQMVWYIVIATIPVLLASQTLAINAIITTM